MISSPSALTHRVYGVSFSVLNLLASSSETSAFFLAVSAIRHSYTYAVQRILTKKRAQSSRTKKVERQRRIVILRCKRSEPRRMTASAFGPSPFEGRGACHRAG